MHKVFISYSSKDYAQAESVRNILERNDIKCWMAPRDIPGGSNYTREIPVAIRECQVFVLILSDNAQGSHWVLKELDTAVNNGKVILPFMLEECQLNDEFNFLLTGAQRYEAYQKKSEAMETLIRRIQAVSAASEQPEVKKEKKVEKRQPVFKKEEVYFGVLKCPACGGDHIQENKNLTGRFGKSEKLTRLINVASGILFSLIYYIIGYTIIMNEYHNLKAIQEGLKTLLWAFPAGFIVGWFVSNLIISSVIKNKRIRKQIHPNPFCCLDCNKYFLVNREKDKVVS